MRARGVLAVTVIGLNASACLAAAELNGSFGFEQRAFFEPGVAASRRGVSSFVLEPELVARLPTGRETLIVRPFYRWESEDENRRHFDVRELTVELQRKEVDIRLGLRKVFWGIAESQHVVDVVNQTDVVESLDLEAKLGQPMVNVNWRPSFASFEFYLLPRFRERKFKRERTRLGPVLPVVRAEYEDSERRKHVDFAARAQFEPIEALEIAVSHFYGTNREPQLTLRSAVGEPALVPYYSIVNQTGLELQWIRGSLALKSESFYRAARGADTFRTVYGFEYTIFQLGESRQDLGLILEHNYDSRRDLALTPFQNDLFLGTRLNFNDAAGSELIAGVFFDVDHESLTGKIEWQHRFGERLTATVNLYSFHESKPQEPLYVSRKDGFIELGVRYHF